MGLEDGLPGADEEGCPGLPGADKEGLLGFPGADEEGLPGADEDGLPGAEEDEDVCTSAASVELEELGKLYGNDWTGEAELELSGPFVRCPELLRLEEEDRPVD
jgi:hypothetical protein